ncbi:MAG: V-type ATPase subunit, partial [Synergistaceae bacterium]|nr:V-type ATPase subunit [Synergistaceae bacterium]
MSRNEAYGYAVARIRAMESMLFDASMFQRMIDSGDLQGALKILAETGYSRGMGEGEHSSERYDSVLEFEMTRTFEELASFVPDRELIDIFRVPYDFHNVKVIMKGILKERSGGKKRWDLLTRLGSISADTLSACMESEDYVLLPYGLSSIIPACFSAWEQVGDIVEIERKLDGGMFADILLLAETVGETGVVKWVKARIDSENIRNLLRLKRFGFDSSAVAAFLHGGGTVDPGTLVSLLSEQFDSWGRALSYSDVGLAISQTPDDGDFDTLIIALEKSLDDYCSAIVERARFSSSAP